MVRKGRKMTLATGDRRKGYSLLEILITLAILALFSGIFLLSFDDGEAEEVLSRCSIGVQNLALKAKKRSYAYRREQYIVVSPGSIMLSDSAVTQNEADAASQVIETVEIPSEVRVEVLAPGESKWQKLNELVWTFRDSGLSDPVGLRFSHGRSYTQLTFNVLTGRAEEETFLE